MNNDGKKDIVCSNGLVLLGNGDGTFTAVSTPAFPYSSSNPGGFGPGLASGDINNDGKPDLVLDTGPTISTYLGNGNGTFTQGASYASINNSGYVTVTDLDGDGNLDIYTGLANGGYYSGDDSSPASAYVLMGNGDGTFVGAPQITGAYNGTNLGDLNGDGLPDIITNGTGQYNTPGPTFTVQLGTTKGIFNPVSTITAPASFVVSGYTVTTASTIAASTYAVADINGDGKADLVFVDNGLNSGTGSQSPLPVYFTALSNGDGTFQTPVPHAFPQIAPAGDFDNSVTVSGLQIADFNHDGHNDLILTYNETAGATFGGPAVNPYNQSYIVLLGNGDGPFKTPPVITSTYSRTTAPATANQAQVVSTTDLNNDGIPDLIVLVPSFSIATGATTHLEIYIGNGDGTFKTPTPITLAANVYGIPAVVDFNKDGKLDLAFLAETSASQAEFAIALGNGDGTFATPTIQNLTGGDAIRSSSIAAADFNADGNIDLALLDVNDFSGVFYGKGDGTFTSVPSTGFVVPKDLINIEAGGIAVAVDLNGDGKPDILAGRTVLLNLYGSAPVVLATSTTALTASATTITTGASVTFTATVTGAAGSTATPTGTITFYNGGTSLGTGTVTSGVATLSTTALPTGSDAITAVYGGDTNFSGSTSASLPVTVNATAPVVVSTTTALSASPTTAVSGASVTFTALVTAASGSTIPTGMVTFTDGATTLGTSLLDGTGKATYTTSTLSVGAHTINASYAGATTFAASASSLSFTVTAAVTPDFTIGLSPTASTVTEGSSTTTTLTITPTGGFNQATALTCSGSPAGATCTVAPSSVTPNGANPVTATATLQTSAQTASLRNAHRNLTLAATLPLGLAGTIAFFGYGFRRRRRWPLLLIALATFTVLVAVSGCGHGSGKSLAAPTTSTLTLTGTSGSTTHSASWTVTIQ